MNSLSSRSTTRLNNEASSSCSTLSDEDSTPLVSRSNSYGRQDESNQQQQQRLNDGAYDIYLRDDHLIANDSSFITPSRDSHALFNGTSETTATTPNSNHATTALFTSANDTPPGYEETISRQRLLKHYHRSNSFVISSPSPSPSGSSNNKPSSAKTKLIFTQYTNSNSQTTAAAEAPPLPPKTERPPLPPKQRISRLSIEETYVNSAELQFQSQQQRQFDSTGEVVANNELVYPNYTGPGARIQLSVKSPPQLPPKERGSSSSEENHISSTGGQMRKKRAVSKTKISSSGTQTRTMCNAETQTDETDFYLMYPDEEGGHWHELEDEEEEGYSESNRSMSPEYYPSFSNPEYLQLPPTSTGTGTCSSRTFFESQRPVSAQSAQAAQAAAVRQAGRRKLEPVQSVPLGAVVGGSGGKPPAVPHVDPIIQGEINWSVSQLRTLFNQGQHSPSSGGGSSSSSSSTGGQSYQRYESNLSPSSGQPPQQQQQQGGGSKASMTRQMLMERSARQLQQQQQQLPGVGQYGGYGTHVTEIEEDVDSDQESYV